LLIIEKMKGGDWSRYGLKRLHDCGDFNEKTHLKEKGRK